MASPWTRYRLYNSCCYCRDVEMIYSIISDKESGTGGLPVALVAFLDASMIVFTRFADYL